MSPENFIQYGKQSISEEDVAAVAEVLRSSFLTQGPITDSFERSIANYCGSKFAVSVNSATSGLHLALLAIGVGNGDLVWTSAITFVATSNAALNCGAAIDFVDIHAQTFNISVPALRFKLEAAQAQKKLPKVLIVVHMGGLCAEMAEIDALSQEFGFEVIEDASHAVGASYGGVKVGACQFSRLCIFSFHPVKIITTAEGGMITTNDENLSKRLLKLRTHGIVRNNGQANLDESELWNYYQDELGHNFRMSELHAALGLSQSKNIDSFVDTRNKIAQVYRHKLANAPIAFQSWQYDSYSSYHLMIIRLDLDKIEMSKVQIYNQFLHNGIQANFHYIPVYRHPYYERLGFKKGYCAEAEAYFQDALSIPLHPSLKENEIEKTIHTLEKALVGA